MFPSHFETLFYEEEIANCNNKSRLESGAPRRVATSFHKVYSMSFYQQMSVSVKENRIIRIHTFKLDLCREF